MQNLGANFDYRAIIHVHGTFRLAKQMKIRGKISALEVLNHN